MHPTAGNTGRTNKVVRSLAVAKLLCDGILVYLLLMKIKGTVSYLPDASFAWFHSQDGWTLITLVKINQINVNPSTRIPCGIAAPCIIEIRAVMPRKLFIRTLEKIQRLKNNELSLKSLLLSRILFNTFTKIKNYYKKILIIKYFIILL